LKKEVKQYIAEFISPSAIFMEPKEIPCDSPKGTHAIVDLFCLARCKVIHQAINYSTFSLIASLIGNVPLKNYFMDGPTLMHGWLPEKTHLTDACFDPWHKFILRPFFHND
jgi:hypothetical protein